MNKLKDLLATLLITRQVVGNVKESLIPFVKKHFKQAKMSNEEDTEDRGLSQIDLEASHAEYEGTFDDYLEMFIQFGYVTLFSSAYPLAAVWALVNNVLEIRGDAFKLCHVHQRPFGQRVRNVGTWQTAMEAMGIVGCLVNCALIGVSGQVDKAFPGISIGQTIFIIVVLEV